MKGPIRLSYSSINTYEQCPLQYRYRYVDRLEWEPKPALSFGNSLHEALEWFYSVKTPHPPDLAELLSRLSSVWVKEGYADEAEEGRYFEHAQEVLTTFYRANVGRFRMPVAVEQRFQLELEGFVLTGKIDRMDRHDDGSYEILDYKTNRKLPPRNKLAVDLQLPIYQYAAGQVWGVVPGQTDLLLPASEPEVLHPPLGRRSHQPDDRAHLRYRLGHRGGESSNRLPTTSAPGATLKPSAPVRPKPIPVWGSWLTDMPTLSAAG